MYNACPRWWSTRTQIRTKQFKNSIMAIPSTFPGLHTRVGLKHELSDTLGYSRVERGGMQPWGCGAERGNRPSSGPMHKPGFRPLLPAQRASQEKPVIARILSRSEGKGQFEWELSKISVFWSPSGPHLASRSWAATGRKCLHERNRGPRSPQYAS